MLARLEQAAALGRTRVRGGAGAHCSPRWHELGEGFFPLAKECIVSSALALRSSYKYNLEGDAWLHVSVPVNNKVACVRGICTYGCPGGRGPRDRGDCLPVNLPKLPSSSLATLTGVALQVTSFFQLLLFPECLLAWGWILLTSDFSCSMWVMVSAGSQRRMELETCSPSTRAQLGLKQLSWLSDCPCSFSGSRPAHLSLAFQFF